MVPIVLVKAIGQAFVLNSAQIIGAEVFEAHFTTLQRHSLLVLPAAIVLLQLIIKDFLQLHKLSLLYVLVNLGIQSFL